MVTCVNINSNNYIDFFLNGDMMGDIPAQTKCSTTLHNQPSPKHYQSIITVATCNVSVSNLVQRT